MPFSFPKTPFKKYIKYCFFEIELQVVGDIGQKYRNLGLYNINSILQYKVQKFPTLEKSFSIIK